MSIYTSEIAANRFGLGARLGELDLIQSQEQEWLFRQIKPLLLTKNNNDSRTAFEKIRVYKDIKKTMKNKSLPPQQSSKAKNQIKSLRAAANQYSTSLTADTIKNHIQTNNSFQARLLDFFSNHFSVSATNFQMRVVNWGACRHKNIC
jgi:uncharacterized protein (DUF1800 family)